MSLKDTLVLDVGSYTVKCGLASAALRSEAHDAPPPSASSGPRPPFVVPSVAGRRVFSRRLPSTDIVGGEDDDDGGEGGGGEGRNSSLPPLADGFVGLDVQTVDSSDWRIALRQRGPLRLSYPIQSGVMCNAQDGYRLLKQAVNASLIPSYYLERTSLPPHCPSHTDRDSCAKGTRAIAERLEQQRRNAQEQQRRDHALSQLDDAGDEGEAEAGGTHLFGSYYTVCGGAGRRRHQGDVLESFPQFQTHHRTCFASLVEPPFSSRRQRARLAELLFEGGARPAGPRRDPLRNASEESAEGATVEALFTGVAPLLSLYGSGLTTGVVLEVGHDVVSTACAVKGLSLTPAMQRSHGSVCGGDAVTEQLRRLIHIHRPEDCTIGERHAVGSGTNSEKVTVGAIKERCCQVLPGAAPSPRRAADTAAAAASFGRDSSCYPNSYIAEAYRRRHEAVARLDAAVGQYCHDRGYGEGAFNYPLPDGSVMRVPAEAALQAAEVHFNPSIAGYGDEALGVVDVLSQTLTHGSMRDHPEVRPLLLSGVVLSGGATLMRGFARRLLSELQQQTPSGVTVTVVAPKERGAGAWLGAAFLSQLSSFPGMCVSRSAYEEEGEGALHARLFA